MPEPLVQYKIEDSIAQVTLNNPPLNSLTMATREALRDAFLELGEQSGQVRAVVLSGGGEQAFAAGADIKAFLDLTPETALPRLEKTHQIFSLVENYRWPVIAAIHGFCLGGGLELALCCDIRYASADAVLGFPEVNLSIFPGNGGMARGMHFLGLGRFKELVYTGRRISAAEAYEYGLVEKVVPREQLMGEALGLARSIAKRGPLGVAAAKKVINQTRDLAVAQALAVESRNWADLAATEDMKEGARAFVEKRKPLYNCR
ncbi:MAG: enoyl-CoA hydratase/isomerase family protein [Proteobacteria bacterium]|nr:enoyl-CoA hydratase/isomerase family protein [Pseudomonadota bacterium]MBU1452240.1 enoyl-CoA hydratase/isomerase family protein [Pseudomonadota bacterium]MBU2470601.1 enoyl-CoA hydratase/isomerase family protein [Pseudomonadota bacterium]